MHAHDHELLHQFAQAQDEGAFRELVDRHIVMVFGVAVRVTGDPQLAEEVTQTTFAILAQKADALNANDVIAGWLYHTARHLALRAIRAEQRRRQREQIAAAMNFNEPGPNVVAEHLESAMDQLKPEDRDALVLRFFEDRNLRDVGLELGLSEDAARMRVNRALEKLRGIFGKLGIAGSIAWLTATLPTSASATVPVGLAASITTAVLSGTAIATTAAITHGASTTMNILNLKTGAAILAAAAITGTSTYLVKDREADRLQYELEAAHESRSQLATAQQQAAAAIKLRDDQITQLKMEVADLPRLRGEVDRLRREQSNAAVAVAGNTQMSNTLAELMQENTSLTNRLSKSLTASWVFERNQWANRGQNSPVDAFQTFLWAWNGNDQAALDQTVSYPDETTDMESRRRFASNLGPREEPPATKATRVKVFWIDGDDSGDTASVVGLSELQFAARPQETREYLMRWNLVKHDGRWLVTGRERM